MRFLLKSGAKIEVCKPQTSKYFDYFFTLPKHHLQYFALEYRYFAISQIIVLLTALNKQIFFVKQVGSRNYLVKGIQFLFIQTKRHRLEPAYAFRLSKQIQQHYRQTDPPPSLLQPSASREISNWGTPSNTASSVSSSNLLQCFGSSITKQDVGCIYSCIIVLFGMNHDSHFLGQTFLKDAQVRSLLVLGRQCFNFFLGQMQ